MTRRSAPMAAAAAAAAAAVMTLTINRGNNPHPMTAVSAAAFTFPPNSAVRNPNGARTRHEFRRGVMGTPGADAACRCNGRGSALGMSSTAPSVADVADVNGKDLSLPELGDDGVYHILNKEQHRALLEANKDKLIVIKFFAPWCRACKGLEPKFLQIVHDKKYADLPLVWADLTVLHNKDYVKSLGVLALPSIHMYAGSDGLIENFPCGPSKVPILKRKLVQVINERVDPKTRELKVVAAPDAVETEPCMERGITGTGPETQVKVGDVTVSEETMNVLRNDIPYFKDFTDEEFTSLMQKAKFVTFEPGSVIVRQGMPGNQFYVIDSGEVEISVKAAFEDPLTTPSSYLGAVINRLTKHDFFGERSCITGEPRAASVRAVEKTRCFQFDTDDIPSSSILSGKKTASPERLAQVNDKYGVDVYDIDFIKEQFKTANVANQARGSVNTPMPIRGVDTDEDIDELEVETTTEETPASAASFGPPSIAVNGSDDLIIPLLVRFKLLRQAARCFEYIMRTKPRWGDRGEIMRRSLLVSKLTPAQKEEFTDVFKIIDESGDGLITLLELKRVLESIGEEKSDEELQEMINKADPSVNGNSAISFKEFMGVMAEAEFYYLFSDTFNALDKNNSGYVKAGDLDRVLCGMRDLISDDRKSIIDVEDRDMLVDYEQFSKMLLGTL